MYDWIPPKTFFRQWLHPLFGEWTPYFVSTLSTTHIYIYIYIHPARVSISFEITYYSERMAVFEAGMYIVGESSNAIYRPVPWDNRQLLRFDPSFSLLPRLSHPLRLSWTAPTRKRVRAERGIYIQVYRFRVDGALFRSSVNNEACKHALWTPRQIASVSTKACDTRGRADTRDRAEHRILRSSLLLLIPFTRRN